MKLQQIARSLLETDLYKFSMGQAIFHQFIGSTTKWAFKSRNEDIYYTEEMVEEIKEQVKAFCNLRFKEDELEFLSTIPWIKRDYIDYLRYWHPRYEEILIDREDPCGLRIEAEGTWLSTSQYEIHILYIVSEVYSRMGCDYEKDFEQFKKNCEEMFKSLREGKYYVSSFTNFGLRRRMSAEAEEYSVKLFATLNKGHACSSKFIGVSNVYLGYKYGLKVFGTMAHEWIMCAGLGNHKHNPAYANWYALDAWFREYGVLLGTALTDTITTACFLKDFQYTFASTYSGVRHDSGDPFEWGDNMVEHYKQLGIDPMTKSLLFSDSLNFEKADEIFRYFRDKAKVSFGIGTFLTNNAGRPAPNIVMKVVKCNGRDVAKLSDCEGKGMCKNEDYLRYLRESIAWRDRI